MAWWLLLLLPLQALQVSAWALPLWQIPHLIQPANNINQQGMLVAVL
jgi:hypothetical protein